MELPRVAGHLFLSDGLPRVDWDVVGPRIVAQVPEAGLRAAWTAAAREWLGALRESLGAYRVDESENFLLLSAFPPRTAANLVSFLERSRARILDKLLPGIADGGRPGKQVAISIDDIETYYTYIAHYYPPEGHFSVSGGVTVGARHGGNGWGYGHFVVHGTDVQTAERVIVHELTHDLVSHRSIPAWLNEGLATTVESLLMGDPALAVVPEDIEDLRAQWREGGIQEFWSGASVQRPDDGSRLTYLLGRMAVKALSYDYERFREFVVRADRADAGESAAVHVYGRGLGGLIEQFLGRGAWTPLPQTWARHTAEPSPVRTPPTAPTPYDVTRESSTARVELGTGSVDAGSFRWQGVTWNAGPGT